MNDDSFFIVKKRAVPEVLLKNVKEDIDLFVADAPQFDDITMLGITWN